jgi:GNAT superfamily N-acetyltransferase
VSRLACDLRIAAEDASSVCRIVGVIPGAGGTQRLPRLVGLALARDLVLSGRRVGAHEALTMGLVDRVVSSSEVHDVAIEEARRFAEGPTAAYAAAKRALAAADGPLEEGLRVERDVFVPLFATHDQERDARLPREARPWVRGKVGAIVRVRQATPEDVPSLVALFQELDRLQADWRVFTPRPGFYDEVGAKYREAMANQDALVLVAEDDEGEVVGMAYGEAHIPSRFSDERALEISGVVVRAGYRGRGVGRARHRRPFAAERGSVGWAQDLRSQPWGHGVLGGPGLRATVVQLTTPTKDLPARLDQAEIPASGRRYPKPMQNLLGRPGTNRACRWLNDCYRREAEASGAREER